jgi:hypothetical protein
MGPIDYIVIEWQGKFPNGEAMPHLVDLAERGIIHVLDLRFIAKGDDGSVLGLTFEEVAQGDPQFAIFEGASAGVLDDEDLKDAAEALEPGCAAAVLVFENTWAAPFATALRKSGAQLVANGRIPVQAMIAALEAEGANA